MPRSVKLLAAAAACLMLSACNTFSPATDDLMRPPRLTPEQRELNDALDAGVQARSGQDYSLKYPKSGDYRSAFVFQDLDGDGSDEVLAFYQPSESDTACIALLVQQDGVWRSIRDLPGEGQDVEFVAFGKITSQEATDVVVGWSSPQQNDKQQGGKTLQVYSYSTAGGRSEAGAGQLESVLADGAGTDYALYLLDDLDRNGLDDLILLSENSPKTEESYWIRLFTFDGDAVSLLNEQPLTENMLGYAGVTAGRLTSGSNKRAVFIDESIAENTDKRTPNMLVTEVFTLTDGALDPVVSYMQGDGADDADYDRYGPDYQRPSLYQSTKRVNTALETGGSDTAPAPLCADIDNDRAIEIPITRPFPGYDQLPPADRLYLTEYNRLEKGELVRVFAAAINRRGGYMVEFPPEWIGAVTIVNQTENSEWRFIGYNGAEDPLSDLSVELARIRVVSQKDYQDKFLENYRLFDESRGIFNYYGYLPGSSSSPLAVTWEELSEMFSLL